MRMPTVGLLLGLLFACTTPQRIGVFSGTFSPPTLAHQTLVKDFETQFRLDRVYVVPNVVSKHKQNVLAYPYRRDMTRLAFADQEKVVVADPALESAYGENGMTGVLEALGKTYPEAQLFQLMGSDSYQRYKSRPGKKALAHHTVVGVPRDGETPVVDTAGDPVVVMRGTEPEGVSSTKVRAALAKGVFPPELAPRVADYIRDHRLYDIPAAAASSGR